MQSLSLAYLSDSEVRSMMKHIALAGMAFATLTGMAAAADLPMRSAPPAPFYAAPVFTWTGFYLGVNAGYAFDHQDRFSVEDLGSIRNNSDGFTGGGQVGYNYQFGAGSGIVIGVEADAAYMGVDKTSNFQGPYFGTVTRLHSGLDYLGTVRGRLGYAFGQFLVYGTGGFAYGGDSDRVTLFQDGAALGSINSGRTRTGFTYGGGVEYALPASSFLNFFHSSAVTVKVEYLHYDLGSNNASLTVQGLPFTGRFHDEGNLVRVGLNYKF
jgi:outer membrane immunogenic protein